MLIEGGRGAAPEPEPEPDRESELRRDPRMTDRDATIFGVSVAGVLLLPILVGVFA